ncbi:hypothetical protein KIM372_09060 [Bombiscardovia nodaiensis]|uniref:Uncharacterized protein n=1 Tax=Bombiscardovia nodaiensis TaxID=2932181 RepID=A0ABM8B8U6_9BIFI|nr:hypothetical protein KIM372_09060 [Bombiscardovia nodaiensis]
MAADDPAVLRMGLSLGSTGFRVPVRYIDARLVQARANTEAVGHLAQSLSSLSCRAFDVMRGHLRPELLRGQVTPVCIDRLRLAGRILEGSGFGVVNHSDTTRSYPPVFPTDIEMFLLNEAKIESVVSLMLMNERYQANLTLEVQGSVWVCSFLDVG